MQNEHGHEDLLSLCSVPIDNQIGALLSKPFYMQYEQGFEGPEGVCSPPIDHYYRVLMSKALCRQNG